MIPTLTSVTPSAGRSTGTNLVNLVGTGFRLPVIPTGIGGGEQQRTVKVSFGGVVSEWAYAASATLILARVPAWVGPYDLDWPIDVDVRVANLDDSEVEIPTENATLADGYAYTSPDLVGEPYIQSVCRELVKLFRRHLMSNVWLTVDADYTDSPADQDRLLASAPVIHLVGPSGPMNRFDSVSYDPPFDDPDEAGAWLQLKEPVTVDLGFDVNCYAATARQLLALGQAFSLFQRDVTDLTVPDDPAVPAGPSKTYEMAVPFDGLPNYNTQPVSAGLFSWSARIVCKGVQLDNRSGTVIRRGWSIVENDGEPTVETQEG